MNKSTILLVIATATLVFGMATSNLVANATDSKNNDWNSNWRNNWNNNWNWNNNDDDKHHKDGKVGMVVNDPPTVKVYKVVINNQESVVPSVASFGIKLNNTQITTNGTLVTIAPDKPVILNETGLDGYEFVEIRGDGHCPENLGGTITLDNAQHIECYIVNQPAISSGPVEPGVIFHYNTLQFSFKDPSYGDSCSAPGKVPPCVELANVNLDGSVLVVDDELKTDTTIVLFSVVEQGKIDQNPPQFATSPLCVLSGMGPHTASYAQEPEIFPVTNPTGTLGFEFQCSLIETELSKVSYALIETQR
ncbi:MAG: hypothetical protein ABI337_03005 [Nitrososphaera sp.]|jgi:hypothetical protein